MPETPIPEELTRPLEIRAEAQTLNPAEAIQSAQDFFRGLGVNIDKEGLIFPEMAEEKLQALAKWHKQTRQHSIDMPDEEAFYKKVLLGVSLWRQEQEGKINYLMGKGVGLEISLRGSIEGRVKRSVKFPYRSHSDFELYAAYDPEEGDAKKKVYTPPFIEVFGAQEYFPSTDTKGLKNLPPRLLYDTSETVNLGGIKVKVPELELQFLDKWLAQESTPRAEGNDAELLARQYILNKDLIHKYIDQFKVKPALAKAEQIFLEKSRSQFEAVQRMLKRTKPVLEEEKKDLTAQNMVDQVDRELTNYLGMRHVSIGGVDTDFWVPLQAEQIDEQGNIIDDGYKKALEEKIREKESVRLERIKDLHRELDELFDKIEKDYASLESI